MTQVIVVSYDGPDSGIKLLGVAMSQEVAERLMNEDFARKGAEGFVIVMAAATIDENGATLYPIIEEGEDPEFADEFYIFKTTWLHT